MKTNITTKKLWLIPIALLLISAVLYPFLPSDIPMQFSISGEANWTLPKVYAILILPFIEGIILVTHQKPESRTQVLILLIGLSSLELSLFLFLILS